MRIKIYCILLTLLLFSAEAAYSQENRTEIYIDFRVNSMVVDSAYSANATHIQEIIEFLRNIRENQTINIVEVSFRGAASPEGSDQLNRRLAKGRLSALEKFVRKEVDIPDSLITRSDCYIPWDYLKSQIEASDWLRKDEVLAILEEESSLADHQHPNTYNDSRIVKLKALDGGKVWFQMNELFFERMRNACVVFVTYRQKLPAEQESFIISDTTTVDSAIDIMEILPDTTAVDTVVPEVEEWIRKVHIKTNAIGLGMAIANIAAEIDLTKHWSFSLPVYHCAWNYFKSTIKFRVSSIYPEIRYWFSEDNDGFYTGVHAGAVFYNFAFNGDYRYQRHNREIPAFGGGVGVGYRMPISKNDRWRIEFQLGAGVYPLHYDKFRNTPNTKDGLLVETIKKTYWGVDQIAVSFSYMFDLKKKGGKR